MATPTKTGFLANEPLVVGAFVAWLFSVAGTFILGHTDLVSSQDWSNLSTVLVPVIAGLLLTGLTWLTRKVVTPAWKKIETVTEKAGIPDDLLNNLVANGVARELDKLKDSQPVVADVVAGVEAHEGDAVVQTVVDKADVVDTPTDDSVQS